MSSESRKPTETSTLLGERRSRPRLALLQANAPGHCGGVDVDRAVVELYGLAPEEFTAARNALVKATKDAGDHTTSDSLKALRKPTLAAWRCGWRRSLGRRGGLRAHPGRGAACWC